MCISPAQLLLATHTQVSSQLLALINNATYVYIICIHMFIYTYVHIVQKRPYLPIPRPCHAHKVDTSPAKCLGQGNNFTWQGIPGCCYFNQVKVLGNYKIKITTTWNSLPSEVVSSRTVNSLKNSLDKHWTENPPNVRVNWQQSSMPCTTQVCTNSRRPSLSFSENNKKYYSHSVNENSKHY